MSDRPTIHLTNWSSTKLHGPGRKWTIMARPRAWEHGDGALWQLAPMEEDLLSVKAGTMSVAEYRARCETRFTTFARSLTPGILRDRRAKFAGKPIVVEDGDTLCCSCGRGAECHRRWAAPFLVRAGWRVILDGVEITE